MKRLLVRLEGHITECTGAGEVRAMELYMDQSILDFARVTWPNRKNLASVVPLVFPRIPMIRHCTRHRHTIGFETSLSLKYSNALVFIVLMVTTFGGTRLRWDDNIQMDLLQVGCGGYELAELAQNRNRWRALVNAVMNLLVPYSAGNFFTN